LLITVTAAGTGACSDLPMRAPPPKPSQAFADVLKNSATELPDGDVYAPEVGFVGGFPAARDPKTNSAWLVHCYGMVGAGRDNDVDTGNGAELYAVNGSPTRHIDRNAALVGRVLEGMALLSSLPRGTAGGLGMYEKPEQRVPIERMRLAADLPEGARASRCCAPIRRRFRRSSSGAATVMTTGTKWPRGTSMSAMFRYPYVQLASRLESRRLGWPGVFSAAVKPSLGAAEETSCFLRCRKHVVSRVSRFRSFSGGRCHAIRSIG
jgi:cyclophilin family peptidyl-prolyl cis-trans isomerase